MCFDVSGTDLVDSVNCDKETKTCLGVQCILQLAHAKTPIHYWSLPGVPKGIDIYIKRDDLTGSSLTGNKVSSKARCLMGNFLNGIELCNSLHHA